MSLIVVTGPPGAGKSTVARLLGDRFDRSVVVAGDAFFAFLASGAIEPWRPESSMQNETVTRAAAAATAQYVEGGCFTIYDGVVGPWFLPTFMTAAGLDHLDYAMLMPPVDACVERVETRLGHGFHNEAATRKMHDEFSRARLDRRHVIDDVHQNVAEVVEVICARLGAGGLRISLQ